MKSLFIEKLQLKNFRDFENNTFEFGMTNTIMGDNQKGKSSLLEAIAFALYGITATGTNHCDPLIKMTQDSLYTNVVVILSPGKRHTIERTRTVAAEGVNTLKLDGKKSTQEKINDLLGIEGKTFLSAFNLTYLQNEAILKPGETRKYFTSLCQIPEDEEVLRKLPEQTQQVIKDNLNGENLSPSDVVKKIKHLEDEYQPRLQGNKSELERQISDLNWDVSKNNVENIKNSIEALRADKQRLEDNQPVKPEIQLEDIKALEQQIVLLANEYRSLEKRIVEAPKKPEPGQLCKECEQTLPPEKMKIIIKKWEDDSKAIEVSNKATKESLKQKGTSGAILKTQLAKARIDNPVIEEKYNNAYAAWESQIKESRLAIEKIGQDIEALIKNQGVVETTAKSHKKLTGQLEGVIKVLNQADLDKAKYTLLRDAMKEFCIMQTELIVGAVKPMLKDLTIQLFETGKESGEAKPIFRFLFENKQTPYLCTSEKTRAGLEISSVIRKLKAYNLPVFVDCCESIGRFTCGIEGVQSFCAFFVEDQELTIMTNGVLPVPDGEIKKENPVFNGSLFETEKSA